MNEKLWSELLTYENIPSKLSKNKQFYLQEQIYIYLNDSSLENEIVKTFCQQFDVKLIKNIL